MTFRRGLLAPAALFGLVCLGPIQVQGSGLYGPLNTVQAFYYNGVFASPEGEIPMGATTTDPTPLNAQVNYTQGAADGSTIAITNTQIIITNVLSDLPFCVTNASGSACPDLIDGFDFLFTGENILGVSVNSSSAADFLPVTGTFQNNTHLGLQLISPNEIRVDVTGDLPFLNDQLILDASFVASSVPEPSTLLLVGGALAFCLFFRRVLWRNPVS